MPRGSQVGLRSVLPCRGLCRAAWLAGGAQGRHPMELGWGAGGDRGVQQHPLGSVLLAPLRKGALSEAPGAGTAQPPVLRGGAAVGSAQVRKGFSLSDIPLGQWHFPGHAERQEFWPLTPPGLRW